MSDYIPGAGAKTLPASEAVRTTDGLRVVGISQPPGKEPYAWCIQVDGDGTPDEPIAWPWVAITPDLTDRATFLLALDELALRVNLDPTGGCRWRRQEHQEMGLATRLGGWFLDVYCSRWFLQSEITEPTHALDFALWSTRDSSARAT